MTQTVYTVFLGKYSDYTFVNFYVYLIPSIVSDVAAIFVATTTFLTEELGGSNTLFCNSAKQICFIVKSTNITEKFTKGILSR